MCMYIHGEVKEHVAEKGFWVYKRFVQGPRGGLSTPHRGMRMQLGKLYEIPKRTPMDAQAGLAPWWGSTSAVVYGGVFHAYRREGMAQAHASGDEIVVACWVPKGTRYWLGSSISMHDEADHICVRALKPRKIVKP